MATLKRFWDDPYCTQLDTTVATVAGADITLAETIFYALSGGQESDRGTIAGLPVLDAAKRGLDIVYTLPPEHGLHVGQAVRVAIDGARRYRLMRLHFAAELVLELVYRQFPGIEKVGAHIGEDKARIDFSLPEPITPHLPDLARAANDIVAADLAIVTDFSDVASQRRYWEIDGFARVPCGGTHVRRTGEVRYIALKRKNIGKGKERIEITAADLASNITGARP